MEKLMWYTTMMEREGEGGSNNMNKLLLWTLISPCACVKGSGIRLVAVAMLMSTTFLLLLWLSFNLFFVPFFMFHLFSPSNSLYSVIPCCSLYFKLLTHCLFSCRLSPCLILWLSTGLSSAYTHIFTLFGKKATVCKLPLSVLHGS